MGQTILTIASIILLAIVTMSIQQMYVQSVHNTVDTQETADALNFGRDIAEDLHSYAFMFDQLDGAYGNLNDVTDADSRLVFESQIDGTLYAIVELSGNEELIHGQSGRRATIRIFKEEKEDEFRKMAEYITAISPIEIN